MQMPSVVFSDENPRSMVFKENEYHKIMAVVNKMHQLELNTRAEVYILLSLPI